MPSNENSMSPSDIGKIVGAIVIILIAIFIIVHVYKSQQPIPHQLPGTVTADGKPIVQPLNPKAAWIQQNKQAFEAQLKQQKGH